VGRRRLATDEFEDDPSARDCDVIRSHGRACRLFL